MGQFGVTALVPKPRDSGPSRRLEGDLSPRWRLNSLPGARESVFSDLGVGQSTVIRVPAVVPVTSAIGVPVQT